MTRHLAVARLWYEANSFSPTIADRAAFERREWLSGEAALVASRGTNTELAALEDFKRARPDWAITVLRCASASPSGPMDDDLFTEFHDEVIAGIAARKWDAVYLSLHGACVTTRRVRPELGLIAAVKGLIGDAPLGVSFDLHGNLAPETARYLAYASAYRTYPHVDMRETANRVLDRLATAAEGRLKPVGAVVKIGAMLPSFNMRTEVTHERRGPMAEIQALARALESGPVLDVSAFGGFPYADTPDGGGTAMAFADGDAAAAQAAARTLALDMFRRRVEFDVRLPPPAKGIARALAGPPGLVCVTDPADNPYSGGIADTPGLFRALLQARPAVPTVFAFFCDPPLITRAREAGVGAMIDVTLGGRVRPEFGAPVEAQAIVMRFTDGRFVNTGPMETGLSVDLGTTMVLDIDGIQVIVTETCQAANDPAFFALHGVDLDATRLLCVKAKNHFRAAFQSRASLIVDTDSPGPACLDLSRLPYRKLPQDLRISEEQARQALIRAILEARANAGFG
jgi:microcystin degradation protein MlrC